MFSLYAATTSSTSSNPLILTYSCNNAEAIYVADTAIQYCVVQRSQGTSWLRSANICKSLGYQQAVIDTQYKQGFLASNYVWMK